jgi:hypothetical protein
MSSKEIEQAEMALKVSEELIPAIKHLRKTDTWWVFNRKDGRTVCITGDFAHAAQVSKAENIPLEVAAKALPISLTIH